MKTGAWQWRLSVGWYLALGGMLLPWVLCVVWMQLPEPLWKEGHPLAFAVALLTMFASLGFFRRYKKALLALEQVVNTKEAPMLWERLWRAQIQGLVVAAFPAWCAAVLVFIGLHGVPLFLLVLSSCIISCLYRIPRPLR